MVRLKFDIDDEAIWKATVKGAREIGGAVSFPDGEGPGIRTFVVALDDAEHCYRFGARVALIRAQEIMKEVADAPR